MLVKRILKQTLSLDMTKSQSERRQHEAGCQVACRNSTVVESTIDDFFSKLRNWCLFRIVGTVAHVCNRGTIPAHCPEKSLLRKTGVESWVCFFRGKNARMFDRELTRSRPWNLSTFQKPVGRASRLNVRGLAVCKISIKESLSICTAKHGWVRGTSLRIFLRRTTVIRFTMIRKTFV